MRYYIYSLPGTQTLHYACTTMDNQTHLYHRIAGYVEIIHLESAERLQLLQSEDIKSEEFLADSIIFSEVKVHLQA